MDIARVVEPIRVLARQVRLITAETPRVAPDELNAAGLMQSLARMAKEFADLMNEAAADFADGRIPQDQHSRLMKEGRELIEAVWGLLMLAGHVHQAQYGVRG